MPQKCFAYGKIYSRSNSQIFLNRASITRCHGVSVYPVEIRSVNNLSSSEDCSTDYCQPV